MQYTGFISDNHCFKRLLAVIGLLALTGLSSCGLFKMPQKETDTKHYEADTTVAKEAPDPEKGAADTLSAKKKKEKDSLNQLYPYRFKETYDVVFILPLYLDLQNPEENQRKEKISTIAREFYLGTRMALDTLKTCGKNLNVRVFDSKNDRDRVRAIRKKLSRNKPDLIIGPFFTEYVKLISEFSAREKVNMVAPMAHVRRCLSRNPYFISIVPGRNVIAREGAELINHQFQNQNLFVVRQYDEEERKISMQLDSLIDTSSLRSYNKLALARDNWNNSRIFKEAFKAEDNVVFIPSRSEVFTTSVLSGIKAGHTILENKGIEDDVTVIGVSEWLEFGSLNGHTMEKFQMHILSDYFVDYRDASAQRFVLNYRNQNHTEPSEHAVKGYDLMLLMGKMLVNYGIYFQRSWYGVEMSGLHNRFAFEQIKGKRGWQNFYMHTLLFRDYELRIMKN